MLDMYHRHRQILIVEGKNHKHECGEASNFNIIYRKQQRILVLIVPLDGKTQGARLCCTIDDLCASPRVYEI